jgi:hypothetical protein
LWVPKWHQEGSVKDSKPQGCPFSAPATNNVGQVRGAMLRSLHRSAQWQALTLRLNECSSHQILHKDLHYHPYKIQVTILSELDKVSQLQFCNEFFDVVKNNSNIVNTLPMSVEAHFNVSGYVNKQNCC